VLEELDEAARVRAWLAGGERFDVEFKSDLRGRISDRDLVEAVVCLANGSGGVLLIGVEDDGTVTGSRPRHEGGETDTLRVQALVANSTQPPQSVTASVVHVGVLASLADRDIARALGLAPADEVTTGALLLFGRPEALRRYVPTHGAAFQVLRGAEVEVNDFLYFPLLRLAEEMFARFSARNRQEELQLGLQRVSVHTYSVAGFREALANALIHRDYTRPGAVHVRWSSEQLEISSPGGFPSGIRVDNLLVAPPHPRSPLLADSLKRVGLVERAGRGISRIFTEQLRFGRPAPDYGRSTNDHVIAILPGGPANLAATRWILEQEAQQGTPFALAELQVLAELTQQRRATTAELARLVQRSDNETRRLLMRMVERGWVEARGDGKGRSWHLSSALYRALQVPSGYVRVRGFERSQQETMIGQYVQAHGSVTRAEVAELCAITPDQASRVLRRLVTQGKLVRRGERRGSVYTNP
jgi:ATP-dependent DNA helicase RecG